MSLEYLSDIEKAKIAVFNEDTVLYNAVKKVLLESIYNNGVLRKDCPPDPSKNAAMGLARISGQVLQTGQVIPFYTNEQLGEDLRAMAEGVNLLEQGFTQLNLIKQKPVGEVSPTINIAE